MIDVEGFDEQIVRQVREQFRASGNEFTLESLREPVCAAAAHLANSAFDAMIDVALKEVDAEATKSAGDTRQCEMFPLDNDYALGNGRRIGKRYARREHMLEVLAINDANLADVQLANDALHHEFETLNPFWGAGVSKEEAVTAYVAANPIPDVA